jgi:UDP:flavonoid glycosyltransferase YjiC (YdhE family)
MAHLLFLTWDGAGNQPPAAALAAALSNSGHSVTFAGNEHQRSYFVQRGFDFVLLGRAASRWREVNRERMFSVKLDSVWAASEHLDDVPDLMERAHCDAVIVDCLMYGALAAAEKFQLPAVVFVHSAPGALMPPGGAFERKLLDPVNGVRQHAGLAKVNSLWEAWERFPTFSNSVRDLDPLASQAPNSFRYFGPFAERGASSNWASPWPSSDERPLVLVSFSTGPYWDQTSRILRTVEALSVCPCRVFVTSGRTHIAPAQMPGNTVVVERAPHDAILPKAALTVTHAGHGTLLASLSHGVPLLCLPNPVADQPSLARQIEILGCGLSLDGETASSAAIRAAVERLLKGPSYEARASILADRISDSPGVACAVSELECSLHL